MPSRYETSALLSGKDSDPDHLSPDKIDHLIPELIP